MSSQAILLTGASGFIGREVLRRWQGHDPLRLLVHRRSPAGAAHQQVRGDLSRPTSLAGVCAGIRTVVHLASYIGEDTSRCNRVNALGTEGLVEEATRAGARRIIYLSNAAVYGYAVHRDADETAVRVAPATPLSRSRVVAESAVLSAGGIVLRPLFVYGSGDTRFLPVIGRALRRIPFLIERGRARLSVIAVADLARIICALAMEDSTESGGTVFHATDGHSVTFRELAGLVAPSFGARVPRLSVPYVIGQPLARLAAGIGGSATRAHRLFLVARDHSYDSTRVWRRTGLTPPAPIQAQFPAVAGWYRRVAAMES